MPCETCNILAQTAEAKSSGGKLLAGILVVGGIAAIIGIAALAARNQ